jgi:mono/diheme cytochrome c family protein
MVPLMVLGALLICPAAMAQGGKVAKGRAIYLDHCASCHGINADGKGPVAPALSTPPANLRLLSERYGNPLPVNQIARFIDGRADVKAHGPRDMPVWCEEARKNPDGSTRTITDWVADLVAYLQSIQKLAQQALLQ